MSALDAGRLSRHHQIGDENDGSHKSANRKYSGNTPMLFDLSSHATLNLAS